MNTFYLTCDKRLSFLLKNLAKNSNLNIRTLVRSTSCAPLIQQAKSSQLKLCQPIERRPVFVSILYSSRRIDTSLEIRRLLSTQKPADQAADSASSASESAQDKKNDDGKKAKKQSKFKQLYTQYGPLFLVVHLTTVVMWIYFFFIVSKQ